MGVEIKYTWDTCMYLKSHAGARPDDVGVVELVVDVAVGPGGAVEMLARHAE